VQTRSVSTYRTGNQPKRRGSWGGVTKRVIPKQGGGGKLTKRRKRWGRRIIEVRIFGGVEKKGQNSIQKALKGLSGKG